MSDFRPIFVDTFRHPSGATVAYASIGEETFTEWKPNPHGPGSWRIRLKPAPKGWIAWTADNADHYVGIYATRIEAEAAALGIPTPPASLVATVTAAVEQVAARREQP